MGPARIYPWRKMHRSRAPSIAPGRFFVAQPWADCITNMPGFNLRQAQAVSPYDSKTKCLQDVLDALCQKISFGLVMRPCCAAEILDGEGSAAVAGSLVVGGCCGRK